MRNYAEKVEPGKFEYLPDLIDERFNHSQSREITYLAVIHKLVYEGVGYHRSGSQAVSPEKMLEWLSGDCQDHSVLVASLYKASGFDVCILRVVTPTGPHLLTEVANPIKPIEKACDGLRTFYWRNFTVPAEEIVFEEYDSRYWFPVDTAADDPGGWSNYVGDISSYSPDTIQEKPGGEWEWKELTNRQEV